MKLPGRTKRSKKPIVASAVVLVVAVGVGAWAFMGHISIPPIAAKVVERDAEFPTVDTTELSTTRQQVIALAKTEYEAQPDPTKYSQGVKEAWCADFISWIMNEIGQPYANPNSGSWRIPGVYTLKEYYESAGAFRSVDSGYQPQPGDVAIYYKSPIFGDHVNIVLKNQNGVLTTVGGNEEGRIRVYENKAKNYTGLIGYGVVV